MSLSLPGTGAMVLPSGSTMAANPATGDRSQQLATMQKFADEFTASLGASGYQKLASGLIIQWGTFTSSASADVGVTFPIPFPTAIRCLLATPVASGSNICLTNAVTPSGFNGAAYISNTAARVAISSYWFALGN